MDTHSGNYNKYTFSMCCHCSVIPGMSVPSSPRPRTQTQLQCLSLFTLLYTQLHHGHTLHMHAIINDYHAIRMGLGKKTASHNHKPFSKLHYQQQAYLVGTSYIHLRGSCVNYIICTPAAHYLCKLFCSCIEICSSH